MLRAFSKQEKKVISIISSLEAVKLLGLFLVMPIFTVYGQLYTSSGVLVGVAFGIYGLAMAIFQFPFGHLSDRIGRKKSLVIAMIPFIVGNLICWHPGNIYMLIAGRFIAGAGAVSSITVAFIQESVGVERRNLAMAFLGISIGASFMLGIIMGPLISAIIGIGNIFLLTAILGAVSLLPLISISEHRPLENIKEESKPMLKGVEKSSIGLGMVSFFASALMYSYFYFVSQYHEQFASKFNLTVMLLVPVIVGGLISLYFARLADKGKLIKISYASLAFLAASVPLVFLVPYFFISGYSVMLSSIAFFAGYGSYEIVFPTLVARLSSSNYGSNLGAYNTLQYIGELVGGVIAGYFVGSSINSLGVLSITAVLLAFILSSFAVLKYSVKDNKGLGLVLTS